MCFSRWPGLETPAPGRPPPQHAETVTVPRETTIASEMTRLSPSNNPGPLLTGMPIPFLSEHSIHVDAHHRTVQPFRILAIPTEIQEVIVQNLSNPASRVCFALTCRRFHSMVLTSWQRPLKDMHFLPRLRCNVFHVHICSNNCEVYSQTRRRLKVLLKEWMGPEYFLCCRCERFFAFERRKLTSIGRAVCGYSSRS